MPRASKESRSFPRITRDDFSDFVGKAIRDIGGTGVQKGGNISNLLGRKRGKGGHASIGAAIANHGADGIAFVIVQDESGADEIRTALAMRVVAVAEAAGRNKGLPAPFDGRLVEVRPAIRSATAALVFSFCVGSFFCCCAFLSFSAPATWSAWPALSETTARSNAALAQR